MVDRAEQYFNEGANFAKLGWHAEALAVCVTRPIIWEHEIV